VYDANLFLSQVNSEVPEKISDNEVDTGFVHDELPDVDITTTLVQALKVMIDGKDLLSLSDISDEESTLSATRRIQNLVSNMNMISSFTGMKLFKESDSAW